MQIPSNKNIDWNFLHRTKHDYCSTPKWLPRKCRTRYEEQNWQCCKIHDNQRGKFSDLNKFQADWNLFKNMDEHSELPKWLQIISYLYVSIFHWGL